MPELRNEDPASFLNFLRMPPAMFIEPLARLGPLITKEDSNYRNAIEPGLKLAMTIRNPATGDRYASMQFDFRVPHNTISLCVREVCQAIINEYKDECMQYPTTVEELRAVSSEFSRRWNVSHACVVLGVKHIACRRHRNRLMGLVDADYKFLQINVGGYRHKSDAQIFNASEVKEYSRE